MDYFGADYKKQKGDCADINADEGKQWLVLYASKNSKAGKPLTPNFIVQESSSAPAGYEGVVHLIGEKGAVNVVSAAFKDYSTFSTVWQNITGDYSMYIFSKLSNDVKTYDGRQNLRRIRGQHDRFFLYRRYDRSYQLRRTYSRRRARRGYRRVGQQKQKEE